MWTTCHPSSHPWEGTELSDCRAVASLNVLCREWPVQAMPRPWPWPWSRWRLPGTAGWPALPATLSSMSVHTSPHPPFECGISLGKERISNCQEDVSKAHRLHDLAVAPQKFALPGVGEGCPLRILCMPCTSPHCDLSIMGSSCGPGVPACPHSAREEVKVQGGRLTPTLPCRPCAKAETSPLLVTRCDKVLQGVCTAWLGSENLPGWLI